MPNHYSEATKNTLAIILSGGAGNRFGGKDKGLQRHKDRPLIAWVIDAIHPQVGDLILCINRNRAKYERFSYPVVFDDVRNKVLNKADDTELINQGPLAGVVAAIDFISITRRYAAVDQVLISSCDCPYLPCDYVAKLAMALSHSDNPVAVVNDGQRNQNLHCLIRREALQSLKNFYNSGGRAMHYWHKKVGVTEVDFSSQAGCFLNINLPRQLS